MEITVSGGSGVGIAALIDKIADIAMSSRKIKSEEEEKAISNGLAIREFEIAKDVITVIVNPANSKMNRIDSQTLKKIYTGEITSWKDLTGEDKPIVVISRDTNSGTFEVFNDHILRKTPLAPATVTLMLHCPQFSFKQLTSGCQEEIFTRRFGSYITIKRSSSTHLTRSSTSGTNNNSYRCYASLAH